MNRVKRKVTINIDNEVFQKSKQNGVNVSQACTNYLKQLNNIIENLNNQNNHALSLTGVSFSKEKPMAGGEGFEPSTPNLGDWRGTFEDWQRYWVFLENQHFRGGYDRTLYNYTQRFAVDFVKGDLSSVRDLKAGRKSVMKALVQFATFLGAKKRLKELFENFGIDWSHGSSSRLVVDRLLSVNDAEEIWNWVKDIKAQRPEFADLCDLMSACGLRLVEGVNCHNLIVDLQKKGTLELDRVGKDYKNGYFDSRVQVLEHFWFPNLFLRGTKNVYVSYVPREIVNSIAEKGFEVPSARNVVKIVKQRLHLISRFSDIREAQNTFMVKFLKAPEIDFFCGRMAESVFMKDYFNPSQIGDLPIRVFQGIAEIQEKIKT